MSTARRSTARWLGLRCVAVLAFATSAMGTQAVATAAGVASGRLDASFGVKGRVVLPEVQVPIRSSVRALAVEADDSIVAVGRVGRLAVRLRSNGSVDPGFRAPEGDAEDVAVQPDGRVVVATATGLVRLLADGAPDSSFHPEQETLVDASHVVVSATSLFAIEQPADGGRSLVRRDLFTGRLDARFGSDGRVPTATCSIDCDVDLAVASGDRPVVYTDGRVVRYTSTGAIDPSFTPISVPPPPEWCDFFYGPEPSVRIAVDEADRVVVAWLDVTACEVADLAVQRYDAAGRADPRLRASVDLDAGYFEDLGDVAARGHTIALAVGLEMLNGDLTSDYLGPNTKWAAVGLDDRGRAPWWVMGPETGLSDGSWNAAATIDHAGHVVIGGERGQVFSGALAHVDRYAPNGGADTTFGAGGSAVIAPTTLDHRTASPDAEAAIQVLRGPADTLMVAATSTAIERATGAAVDFDGIVQRFDDRGRLDPRYGKAGTAVAELEPLGQFGVASDGSSVIAGDVAITEISAGGVPSAAVFGPGGRWPSSDWGPRADVGAIVADGASGYVLAGADVSQYYDGTDYEAMAWGYRSGGLLSVLVPPIEGDDSAASALVRPPTGSFVMDVVDPWGGDGRGLIRFSAAGQDPSFVTSADLRGPLGVDGAGRLYAVTAAHSVVRVLASGATDPTYSTGPLADQPRALALDSKGRAVVLAADSSVHRYLPSGASDPSFGAGGVATIAGANLVDLVLDAKDRPVVVGAWTAAGREAMWRLTA